jgi:hypothetical protein
VSLLDKFKGVPTCQRYLRWPSDVTAALFFCVCACCVYRAICLWTRHIRMCVSCPRHGTCIVGERQEKRENRRSGEGERERASERERERERKFERAAEQKSKRVEIDRETGGVCGGGAGGREGESQREKEKNVHAQGHKRARTQANNPYRSRAISFTITGTGLLVQHGVAATMIYLKFFRWLRAPAESGLKEILIFEAILSGLSLHINTCIHTRL